MATDLADEDSALNRYRREQQQTTMPSGHVPPAENADEPSRKRKKRADRSATDIGQTMPTIDESVELPPPPPPTANVDYVGGPEMGPAEMQNETTRNSFVHFK